MKIYKVHSVSFSTGKNYLIFKDESAKKARQFFANQKPGNGHELFLSVTFDGSTTLLETK
jgi:hypothetical protein